MAEKGIGLLYDILSSPGEMRNEHQIYSISADLYNYRQVYCVLNTLKKLNTCHLSLT